MTKLKFNTLIISVILCLVPAVAGIIFYNRLPHDIAIHWDVNDQPDNYVSKAFALFVMPALFAITQAFICAAFWQSSKHTATTPRVIKVFLWLGPSLSIMIYTLMLLWSLGHPLNIGDISSAVIGVFFVLLGNYLPKIRYADRKHIISSPTFSSEQSFRRAMRVLGLVFIMAGIGFFILVFV